MTTVQNQLNYIENLIDDNEGEQACIQFFLFIKELEENNDQNLPFLYYKFAFILFDNEFYEDSIIMFNNAYKQNYMKEEIKKFIFNSFIEPNSKDFQESYKNNLNSYAYNNITFKNFSYESLQLEFIPVSQNKYYIYDLEKDTFDEVIDFNKESIENQEKIHFNDNFSDILLLDKYNLNNIKPYIDTSENRIIYYLPLNLLKTLSFFKLPYIVEEYLNNIFIFESSTILKNYFRQNENIYLPKIIIDIENKKDLNNINTIINAEHEFRLLHQHRDDSNILLSICIPSWNRGHRALDNIKSLLTLNYDSEIEFIVSNNGSDTNVDGYKEIKEISDSRISYFEFESNQGYLKNVSKVLDLAKGRFALLLSDEDMINKPSLAQYMYILKNNNEIGLIRSGTSSHYLNLTQSHIKAGDNAFFNFFLTNNYMSGIIYNTKIINEYKLVSLILDNNINNISCSMYFHMWLDAFIVFRGDLYICPDILCIEGFSEPNEKNSGRNSTPTLNDSLLIYQHYESRIEQHYGFIELLNQLPISSPDIIANSYLGLCWKTTYLVYLVKDNYTKHNYDLNTIYNEVYECCINGLSKLNINIDEYTQNLMISSIKKYNENYR